MIPFASRLIINALLNKRAPLIVSWSLTERCNRACRYCGFWGTGSEEMDKDSVLSLVEELSCMGTKRIQFTGGEPLLREDLGDILDSCKKKKIVTNVNSNGSLVLQRISELKKADSLSLSLDGPREIHDSIRGNGSYHEVMDAVRAAKNNRLRLRLLTVLSSVNLDSVDFILSKAEELKTVVLFQPATSVLLNGDKPNPIAPPKEKYREAINKIIRKKRTNRYIGNSVPGLKHLYHWPDSKAIRCLGKYIFCRIDSNGDVKLCPRVKNGKNCLKAGFKAAFDDIEPTGCGACWCASTVEMSLLSSLDPRSLLNALKFI